MNNFYVMLKNKKTAYVHWENDEYADVETKTE